MFLKKSLVLIFVFMTSCITARVQLNGHLEIRTDEETGMVPLQRVELEEGQVEKIFSEGLLHITVELLAEKEKEAMVRYELSLDDGDFSGTMATPVLELSYDEEVAFLISDEDLMEQEGVSFVLVVQAERL